MIATQPVQAAIRQAMVNAEIAGGRVVDHTPSPEEVAYPYVEIGDTQILSDDVQCSGGVEEFLSLHIWSRYEGQKEAREIAAAISSLFHAQSLTVTGYSLVTFTVQQVRIFDDPDGLTRHGVLTLHIHAFE